MNSLSCWVAFPEGDHHNIVVSKQNSLHIQFIHIQLFYLYTFSFYMHKSWNMKDSMYNVPNTNKIVCIHITLHILHSHVYAFTRI